MQVDRGGDDHRVDLLVADDLLEILRGLHLRVQLLHVGQPLLVLVADVPDLALRQGAEVPDEVRPPVPASHDGDVDGLAHGVSFSRRDWDRFLRCARLATVVPDLLGDRRERLEQDLELHPERHAAGVPDVEAHHVLEGRAVLSAHLPQAGQARRGVEPLAVPLVVFLRFIRQARPRPHQAHVAPQHVDQLGKLVQAGLSQDPPQGDDAGVLPCVQLDHRLVAALDEGFEVLLMRRRVVVDLHRPEFPAFEFLPPETDPVLAEEDRPGVRDLDIDADQQEERGKEDQRDQGENHVENVFPERQLPDEDRRHRLHLPEGRHISVVGIDGIAATDPASVTSFLARLACSSPSRLFG